MVDKTARVYRLLDFLPLDYKLLEAKSCIFVVLFLF